MKKIAIVFLVVMIYNACKLPEDFAPQINTLTNNVTSLQKSRDSLAAALKQTNTNLNATNLNYVALSKSLDSIKIQLNDINSKLSILNGQLKDANANIALIKDQINTLNKQYLDLTISLNSIIYMCGKPIITLGNQIWMARNLDVSTYSNGDAIPHVKDEVTWASLKTGAYCYYNNDSTSYALLYGKLYNWYAINDSRGLAPSGWHIPTNNEVVTLGEFLGGALVAGGKMKSAGTSNWYSPNSGATNSSEFNALPGGNRYNYGVFDALRNNAIFWTKTPNNDREAYHYYLGYDTANLRFSSNGSKNAGYSVRILKN